MQCQLLAKRCVSSHRKVSWLFKQSQKVNWTIHPKQRTSSSSWKIAEAVKGPHVLLFPYTRMQFQWPNCFWLI